MLDVNMGVPLADEADLLARAIEPVQEHSDLPICIDSSDVEALEAGLSACKGKALVNSVTCERDRLDQVLPLVKEHGAAVICLTNDETGIPQTAGERLDLRGRLVEIVHGDTRSRSRNRDRPLAMTVGADPQAVVVTLETIGRIRDNYGLNMTLGASNISFELPGRHELNAAFLVAASAAGLTSAIMDARAPQVVDACRAEAEAEQPSRVALRFEPAVAELVGAGLLDLSSRVVPNEEAAVLAPRLARRLLARKNGERLFVLHWHGEEGDAESSVYLSQRDVRELQFAKASIATGWSLLVEELGVDVSDIQQVLLAGSFGSYVSPASAVKIGLVPRLSLPRIVSAGNVAGEGAKMALLSMQERHAATAMFNNVQYVELSDRPDFNDRFVEQLALPA